MIESVTLAREGIGRRDVAIAGVLSLLGVLLMYINVVDPADPSDPDQGAVIHVGNLIPYEFAIPLFLLVTVPLLWRRAAPLAAVGAAFAGVLVNEALLGTELVRCGVLLPTAFVFAFTVGAQLEGRSTRIGLALVAGFSIGVAVTELGLAVAVIAGVLIVALWGIGRVVRSRRLMAVELESRTDELREARDERTRLEVASDRARLSRELDELLQRRLGDLARLADGAERPTDAAGAAATLADIERESRRTLEEMRAVVGVLRDDSAELPTAPQPTLTHLEALLVRAKGSDARLSVRGNPRTLPAAVELSAYRIAEHLLAALEDTPDVDVQVRFGDDALELTVSGLARRRPKASIERARERARLQRGTLETTMQGGRIESVATLPVLAAV